MTDHRSFDNVRTISYVPPLGPSLPKWLGTFDNVRTISYVCSNSEIYLIDWVNSSVVFGKLNVIQSVYDIYIQKIPKNIQNIQKRSRWIWLLVKPLLNQMANAPSEAPLSKFIEGGVEDFWCDLMFSSPSKYSTTYTHKDTHRQTHTHIHRQTKYATTYTHSWGTIDIA